jgi:hypothetical protein
MSTLAFYLHKATKSAPARRRCRMIAGAAAMTAVLPLSVLLGGCGPPPAFGTVTWMKPFASGSAA